MKKTLFIAVLGLFLGCLLSALSEAKDKPVSAVVAFVKGKLDVKVSGSNAWKPLASGKFVNEGDTVRTGPMSRACVVFADGIETRLNSNSTFQVKERGVDKTSATSIIMSIGQVWTNILKRGTKFDVHTPVAVCSVRGTQYETDVDEHGNTDLKVFEGVVDFHNDYGHCNVGKNSKCSAHAGSAPGAPEPMAEKDKDTWHMDAGSTTTVKAALEKILPEKSLSVTIKDSDGKPTQLQLKFKPK